ncbi:MAG: Holliday junction branch migration DNA helicase RuvB [Patescibacteria group bacterium]|nr:Holliday junction branch migration DNA helicase RuvB [Patescibacteria group bacterium]
MSAKILEDNQIEEEDKAEVRLRPQKLTEFIGQPKLKEQLGILIQAAKERKESLEHLLFYGPPGLGKTTLSSLLAKEMGVNIRITSGPALERAGDLASILTSLEPGDILFIDEVHRLNKVVEETLYPAMEDFCLDMVLGRGPAARTLRLDLNHFTIVAATTRIGLLSSPMRDRFGFVHKLEFYSPENIEKIIIRSAEILGVKIDKKGAEEISKRSRGTPRIANRILRRVRDFAQVRAKGEINAGVAGEALLMLAVDDWGLTQADRYFLRSLAEKHQGGPVGIETLAATVSEDIGTIEEVYEPYLLQIGFLKRTPRGRMMTPRAFEFLNMPLPKKLQQEGLF